MTDDSFSARYSYKRKSTDVIYEAAPEPVRVGLREILAQMGFERPTHQRTIVCKALRTRPSPYNWSDYPNINDEVDDLIHGLEWYEFYDMCEKIARLDEIKEVGYISPTYESVFAHKLNNLFQEENIGYRMTDSYIDKIGSEEFDEAVEEALDELQDPRFKVPLEQFRKALDFRNGLPPDYANAVKEAVNAVEGVLQIATEKPGEALPTILTNLQPEYPSHFERIFKSIYGYGSASEGARHAGVGGPVPSAEEAEFIIHVSAAAIRYIMAGYRSRTK